LRSIADANAVENVIKEEKVTQNINVVRFGIPSTTTTAPTQQ
jgi:hypothetical protein